LADEHTFVAHVVPQVEGEFRFVSQPFATTPSQFPYPF
jgi:hypothetical protein